MRFTFGGLLLLNISVVLGCDAILDLGDLCPGYQRDRVDPISGKPDPCPDLDAGTEAGEVDAAEAGVNAGCAGECVPQGAEGWSHVPRLMWIGPRGQAPPCPERAPQVVYNGFAGLVIPPLSCDGCTCEPSTGVCRIPKGFTAHAAPLCAAGVTETAFDAPATWDGSCHAGTSIPAGTTCEMPPVPCVQSISIERPTIEAESCAVGMVPQPAAPYFELEALACGTTDDTGCTGASEVCVSPEDPFPGGFRHCILTYFETYGDPCPFGYPAGPYYFYEHLADDRHCNCTCGDPAGSKCTAFASIYQDNACTQPLFQNLMITSTDPNDPCANVSSGVAVESQEVTNPSYSPGMCASKGELIGSAYGYPEVTVCCAAERVIH